MNEVQIILERVKALLLGMGFTETIVTNPYRSTLNYARGDLYCIPQYIESMGFLIEYAHSYEDAKKHGYDDGDAFPLVLGEQVILKSLRNEIQHNIENKP